MLLTIFYRKGCIKSRFLRGSLRVMNWELREADIDDPSSEAELLQVKSKTGIGEAALVPAIYTNEVYSHELWPITEYINDRSPDGVYPSDAALRLYARTFVQRVLRKLDSMWPSYIATNNAQPLLNYYAEIEELIEDLVRNRESLRVIESRPLLTEILAFSFLIEINYIKPITNKSIAAWFKEMSADPRLYPLLQEPKQGYLSTKLAKRD